MGGVQDVEHGKIHLKGLIYFVGYFIGIRRRPAEATGRSACAGAGG
jgi:hypothetical protein